MRFDIGTAPLRASATRRPRLPTALVAASTVAVLLATVELPATAAETAVHRPNIVLVTTDDMTDYDLRWMPATRRLIRRQGFEFTDFISPHPLCCPARAELFTGQYAQNNGVHHNTGPYDADALIRPNNNVGKWLHDGGYQTAFVGKFLNKYTRYPVAGWDRFNHSIEGSVYNAYGYEFSGSRNISDDLYIADYVGQKTVSYVRNFSRRRAPMFIWASHVAPHNMKMTRRWPARKTAIPAVRHRHLYPNAMPPSLSKPSFNEADVSDKPAYVRANMRLRDRKTIIHAFRQRIRSLKAVDEQVRNLVHALSETGELANTVIMFTSDNGYLLGEHRLVGKNFLYEEALQIPMLMRGPGVPAGAGSGKATTLVDVAATIADIGGVEPQRTQDGTSLLPVANGAPGYFTQLVQAGQRARPWKFRGVRDPQWVYAEHYSGGQAELYDRDADPYQLRNLAGQKPETQARLAAELDRLRDCTGAACHEMTP